MGATHATEGSETPDKAVQSDSYVGVSTEGELHCIRKRAAETMVWGKGGKPAYSY